MTPVVLFALASTCVLVPALVLRATPIALLAAALGLLSGFLSLRARNAWTLLLVLFLGLALASALSMGVPWPALAVALALVGWHTGRSQESLIDFPPPQREALLRRHAACTAGVSVGAAALAAGALSLTLPISFGPLLLLGGSLPLLLGWVFRLVPLDRRPRGRRRR